jgi:hypothetical protein
VVEFEFSACKAAVRRAQDGWTIRPSLARRFWPGSRSGVGMNLKQAVDQGGLGSAFLFQKLGNLELVDAGMTRCLPLVTNEKASDPAIED